MQSINKEIFDAAKNTYKQELRKSGINEELGYKKVKNKLEMKKRGRGDKR